MGHLVIKDVADITVQYLPVDWRGPVKLEPPDSILRSTLELAAHVEAIEHYLEKGLATGQSFVRQDQRPSVGAEVLNQALEPIRLLDQRVTALERQRQAKGGPS